MSRPPTPACLCAHQAEGCGQHHHQQLRQGPGLCLVHAAHAGAVPLRHATMWGRTSWGTLSPDWPRHPWALRTMQTTRWHAPSCKISQSRIHVQQPVSFPLQPQMQQHLLLHTHRNAHSGNAKCRTERIPIPSKAPPLASRAHSTAATRPVVTGNVPATCKPGCMVECMVEWL